MWYCEMTKQILEIIHSPCCTFHRAYVQHENATIMERAAKSAKALYAWRYKMIAWPPYWQLYLAEEDLTPEELEQVKQGAGPSQVIMQLMEGS